MIRFATNDDLCDLKSLFRECFDLDFFSPYGSFYITNIFNNYRLLVYVYNKKIVSMLTLMPVSFNKNKKILNGFYIWAIGTLKEYRNKSIASQMLDFVFEYSKKTNNYFNILIPQDNNKSLYDFYFKRGFKLNIRQKIIYLNKRELFKYIKQDDDILSFEVTNNIPDLEKYRKENYKSVDFISWKEQELIKIQKEIALPGSNNYILDFKDGQYAVLDFNKNKKIKIKEFYIFDYNFGRFIKTLLSEYCDFEFFEFLLPICDNYCNFFYKEKFEIENIAMIRVVNNKVSKFFNNDRIYFKFGFDT